MSLLFLAFTFLFSFLSLEATSSLPLCCSFLLPHRASLMRRVLLSSLPIASEEVHLFPVLLPFFSLFPFSSITTLSPSTCFSFATLLVCLPLFDLETTTTSLEFSLRMASSLSLSSNSLPSPPGFLLFLFLFTLFSQF